MSLATMMRIITEDTAENEETDEATNTEDFRQTGVTGAARSGQGCETGNDQDRDHGGGRGDGQEDQQQSRQASAEST